MEGFITTAQEQEKCRKGGEGLGKEKKQWTRDAEFATSNQN